jgi:PKD repeat protein
MSTAARRIVWTSTSFLLLVGLALACADQSTPTEPEGVNPKLLKPQQEGSGITGYSGQSGDCASCHRSNGDPPTVTLAGPTTVAAGATSTYTLTLVPAAGSDQTRGGLNVAVQSGTLISTSGDTRLEGGELTHQSPKSGTGTLSWQFDWEAPSSAGTYTMWGAALSADGGGTSGDETDTDALSISVEAVDQPPVADASGPYSGVVGVGILFDGGGSTDDGTIASYEWDFGDGFTGSGPNPTHAYAGAGAYTVTLVVTDDNGASDSDQTTADISPAANDPPIADAGGPYAGTVGQPVQFDGSGSSDDGAIVSYAWDFGDGSVGTGATPTHAYSSAGTYVVTLMVMDDGGAAGTDATTAEIAEAPVQVDYALRRMRVETARVGDPLTVHLTVKNVAQVSGTANVRLSVDGVEICTMEVLDEVARGPSRTVRPVVSPAGSGWSQSGIRLPR